MKIEINEHYKLKLTEVYEPIILETDDKSRMVIVMRDNTIEMTVPGSDKWYRANTDTGEIEEL